MITYRILQKGENEYTINSIAALFREMYDHMYALGLKLPLVKGGENIWSKSVLHLPGKINHLIVAEDKEIIGFAHGNIRLAPDYLGGYKTGFISHVFVIKKYRKQGIASEMVGLLIQSLKEAGASHFELDVLINNKKAANFWISKGFTKELYRMSKTDSSL